MKQVNNTECGPIIVCDKCFDSMNKHSIEIGEGNIVSEDIDGKIQHCQQCDLCGDHPMNVR